MDMTQLLLSKTVRQTGSRMLRISKIRLMIFMLMVAEMSLSVTLMLLKPQDVLISDHLQTSLSFLLQIPHTRF